MRWPILLLPLLLAARAAPAQAPDGSPPACDAGREGMTACFGERLCRCRHEPGGSLAGRPPGHRWDCGVLRPACGVAPAAPDLPGLSLMPMLQATQGGTAGEATGGAGSGTGLSGRLSPRSGAAAAPHGTR
ncbi:hypothetical protein [Roseicella frigidaeris]|uniref:Uncharacterized protein n=1 Tax=Roseicella frigidaeris TaxID=2230885 RepID=A0A327M7D9_9PROT|nr:hypothetical protein [Roseicella frigidaeris]RAI58266.1 hypothetical protein DOO78_14725 [Roseicella frigidaeris]